MWWSHTDMFSVELNINNGQGLKFPKVWQPKHRESLQRFFRNAGSMLTRETRQRLSGPSHVQFPDNGNEYPGVISGNLRKAQGFKHDHESVVVGPGLTQQVQKYAAAQEFGTAKIPARPSLRRALADNTDKIIEMFQKTVAGLLG